MRKIYKSPLTEVVKIKAEQMICDSLDLYVENPDITLVKEDEDYDSWAWLFGSFARGEESPDSDVDLLVEFDKNARVSLMKHAGMIVELEHRLHRPVDLVTDGTLLPFAVESANRDKILIYERANQR